jgi:hypothetical protein
LNPAQGGCDGRVVIEAGIGAPLGLQQEGGEIARNIRHQLSHQRVQASGFNVAWKSRLRNFS